MSQANLHKFLSPTKFTISKTSRGESIRKKKLIYQSFTNKAATDISFTEENHQQNMIKDTQVLRLLERINYLENQLKQKDKEIQKLIELNKYLSLSNSSKMDMIEKERKIKQINVNQPALYHPDMATPKNNEISKLSSFSKKHKTVLSYKSMDECIRPQSGQKKVSNLERLKTGVYHLSTLEETFKISNVIDPQTIYLGDIQATQSYENDGTLKLLNELLQDDEQFIDIIQSAQIQKLSYIQEKLRKILYEHQQLVLIILRFKKILFGIHEMNQSLLLDDCLNSIVNQLTECLDCDRATCFIVDHYKNELWSRVAKGTSKIIRLPLGEGVAGQVAQSKQLTNIRNAYMDPRFNKDNDQKINYKTKTLLVQPILEGDKCLGVLQCVNKINGHFTLEDESLIKIISEFCNVLLNNAINLNEQVGQYNKLRHILKTVIETGKIEDIKDFILYAQQRIQALMNVDKARICYYQKEGKLVFYDSEGILHNNEQQGGLIGESIREKKIIIVNNLYQDVRFNEQIDISTHLPVVNQPIYNPYNQQEVIGALQVIFLKSVNTLTTNETPKLNRMDSEMLNLYCQAIAQQLLSRI